jgi:triacylglycerol lipase
MNNENKLISDNLEEISQAKVMARLAGRSYLDPDDPERQKKRPPGFGKKNPVFVSVENAQAWVYYGTGKIVVACRGTEPTQFADVLADLKTIPVRHDRNGMVHSGFWEEANKVYPGILEAVKAGRKNNEKVYVCGHSLGGAMAVLVAEMLCHDKIPVEELRTFGQPRVGTRKFRRHLEGCKIGSYHRYVNNNDIVPRVPPALFGFVHGGKLMYINSYGNIRNLTMWQRIKDGWRGFWAACKQFKFFDFVADHGMPHYIQHVDNLDEESPQGK